MICDCDFYTHTGGRSRNEDSLCVTENGESKLFAVADGLGGESFGKTASETAVSVLENHFKNGAEYDIANAVQDANARILKKQRELNCKMKTTVAAVVVNGGGVTAVHAGDSRIYAFKDNEIVFQSRDHSVSQMAVDAGEIRPSQIRRHPDRNVLTKALGACENIMIDTTKLDAQKLDAMLLCTDGFWEYVLERDMTDTLKKADSSRKWLSDMRCILESVKPADNDNNTAIAIIFKGM